MTEKFHKQLKCESLVKCVAYTFEQSNLVCMLHSSIDMGLKFTRGKQTGIKKTDYILSLPEVSFCAEKNRKKRCRREPKCQHVNCLRNVLERFVSQIASSVRRFVSTTVTVGGKGHIIELCKVKMDMMLVSSRMNMDAIQINASAHILIKL